jgi:Domain of unknown function (DUF1967)
LIRTTNAINLQEPPRQQRSVQIDDYEIGRGPGGEWVVEGAAISRFAQMTNWDYYEANLRFQKVLEAAGQARHPPCCKFLVEAEFEQLHALHLGLCGTAITLLVAGSKNLTATGRTRLALGSSFLCHGEPHEEFKVREMVGGPVVDRCDKGVTGKRCEGRRHRHHRPKGDGLVG